MCRRLLCLPLLVLAGAVELPAADGSLTITLEEESGGEPTIARLELSRANLPGKQLPVRGTVAAGFGVVFDRSLELALPEAAYQFRVIRGPEYRIFSGHFTLEKTSLDQHRVQIPRMANLLEEGWVSGDCCLPASPHSLPLRMAAEDLHLAAVLGHVDANPIPGRGRDDPIQQEPIWIRHDAEHDRGLVFYGVDAAGPEESGEDRVSAGAGRLLAIERIREARQNESVRVAIEDPFAWPLPVWLASEQVDGVFILGDWLRLDRKVLTVGDGRAPSGPSIGDPRSVGRWAEQIYWQMLEAGLRIPPLAGCGDQGRTTPVGYNRLYVAGAVQGVAQDTGLQVSRVMSAKQWWDAAWRGQSVATNGPLLRPTLGGQIPGHVFQARSGEVLELVAELLLSVRDPVDYLEVIHNGRVHYSARLDEFALQGGVIPHLLVKESSWVTIRVVTLYEDHFRAAMSAPWYIDFDGQRRVTTEAVEFFRDWLSAYEQQLKKLPAEELQRHVPHVRAAREFWGRRRLQSGS